MTARKELTCPLLSQPLWGPARDAFRGSGQKECLRRGRVKGRMFASAAWPGRVEKVGVSCSAQRFSRKRGLLEPPGLLCLSIWLGMKNSDSPFRACSEHAMAPWTHRTEVVDLQLFPPRRSTRRPSAPAPGKTPPAFRKGQRAARHSQQLWLLKPRVFSAEPLFMSNLLLSPGSPRQHF